ncbi:hypothetical protein [Paraurantiacibacter namhicola]|nr:hypothetical protein [Paraurantiacibacter namhicola]
MKVLLIAMSSLALVACQSGDSPEPTPSETMMPVEPDGGIGDGATPLPELLAEQAADGVADDAITDPDLAKGEIPARFRGVWDYIEGTCDPASDMRMDISAREVRFYESDGQVTSTGQDGDAAIVDLAMSGEGEEWFQSTRLQLSENGDRLFVTDATKENLTDDYPRKRCPQG